MDVGLCMFNQLSQTLAPALLVVEGISVVMVTIIWDNIWLECCLYILATAKNRKSLALGMHDVFCTVHVTNFAPQRRCKVILT